MVQHKLSTSLSKTANDCSKTTRHKHEICVIDTYSAFFFFFYPLSSGKTRWRAFEYFVTSDRANAIAVNHYTYAGHECSADPSEYKCKTHLFVIRRRIPQIRRPTIFTVTRAAKCESIRYRTSNKVRERTSSHASSRTFLRRSV